MFYKQNNNKNTNSNYVGPNISQLIVFNKTKFIYCKQVESWYFLFVTSSSLCQLKSAVTSQAELDYTLDTHTHTRLTANFPELPRWAATRKVKPIWILMKQETVGGSGISWAICKSAPHSRQTTTQAPHHSYVFLKVGCPSCITH